LILQLGNIIEGLGYFIPSIYLPTYARSLGASQLAGTLTVVLFNVMSVVGCLIMGSLTDRYEVTTCLSISAIGATLSVFLLWGFSISLPVLYIFALSYGLFAGSYTSIWPGILKEVKKRQAGSEIGMVFSMLAAGRGIGSVVAGPLSEAILEGSKHTDGIARSSAYTSGYAGLVIFTGVTAMLGGLGFVGKRTGWV
jgi:MFS family permease